MSTTQLQQIWKIFDTHTEYIHTTMDPTTSRDENFTCLAFKDVKLFWLASVKFTKLDISLYKKDLL